MKKIISIISAALLMAGCINLDYYPSDMLTSTALASNPAAAVYTTDGIYSMMKDMLEFRGGYSQNNTFVRQYYILNEVKSDNICFSWTSTDPFWTSAQYMDDANSADAAYMSQMQISAVCRISIFRFPVPTDSCWARTTSCVHSSTLCCATCMPSPTLSVLTTPA